MVTDKAGKIARLLEATYSLNDRESVILLAEMVAQLANSVDDETWAKALTSGLFRAGYAVAQRGT